MREQITAALPEIHPLNVQIQRGRPVNQLFNMGQAQTQSPKTRRRTGDTRSMREVIGRIDVQRILFQPRTIPCDFFQKRGNLGLKRGFGLTSEGKHKCGILCSRVGLHQGLGVQITQAPTDTGVGRQLHALRLLAPIFHQRDVGGTLISCFIARIQGDIRFCLMHVC